MLVSHFSHQLLSSNSRNLCFSLNSKSSYKCIFTFGTLLFRDVCRISILKWICSLRHIMSHMCAYRLINYRFFKKRGSMPYAVIVWCDHIRVKNISIAKIAILETFLSYSSTYVSSFKRIFIPWLRPYVTGKLPSSNIRIHPQTDSVFYTCNFCFKWIIAKRTSTVVKRTRAQRRHQTSNESST